MEVNLLEAICYFKFHICSKIQDELVWFCTLYCQKIETPKQLLTLPSPRSSSMQDYFWKESCQMNIIIAFLHLAVHALQACLKVTFTWSHPASCLKMLSPPIHVADFTSLKNWHEYQIQHVLHVIFNSYFGTWYFLHLQVFGSATFHLASPLSSCRGHSSFFLCFNVLAAALDIATNYRRANNMVVEAVSKRFLKKLLDFWKQNKLEQEESNMWLNKEK